MSKTYVPVTASVPIGHQWSVYYRYKVKFVTVELAGTIDSDDDDNYISSHTQDTTALRPIMFLTEMHQILVTKHPTACL
jgi:hypothetical protein